MSSVASMMALTGSLIGGDFSVTFTTTASTSSHGETHTADASFSTSGDKIIHDGWNQQNTNEHDVSSKANYGSFTVAGSAVTVDVEVWGAAGGSGQGSYTGYGGGGEYRKARMVLKPGTYYWMVGGGGGVGVNSSSRQGSGGWGGGGSSGDYDTSITGDDGTPFAEGGDISGISNSRQALGAGGGGLTGIFAATTPSQADALIIAGAGAGFSFNNLDGKPGGDTSISQSATSSAGGTASTSGGNDGGAGYGGSGEGRGGGGGGGYWGGAGGADTGGTGGGGRGFTVSSNGHSLVSTVSNTTTEAGSGRFAGGTSSSNYSGSIGTSTTNSSVAGRGGRLVVTIV